MKALLKTLLPTQLLKAWHRCKSARQDHINATRTPEQVFSEIYRLHRWGIGGEKYCSGSGSRTRSIVEPYVTTIKAHLRSHAGGKPRVLDLGCGDFVVG